VINLDDLEKLADTGELTREVLLKKRILANKDDKLKILARGKIKAAVTVHADAASATAIKAVEKAGGKIILPETKEVAQTKRVIRKESRKSGKKGSE